MKVNNMGPDVEDEFVFNQQGSIIRGDNVADFKPVNGYIKDSITEAEIGAASVFPNAPSSSHHDLKAFDGMFTGFLDGSYTSTIRSLLDRKFTVGDTITLHEGYSDNGIFNYSGRSASFAISSITDYGCRAGYTCLHLKGVEMGKSLGNTDQNTARSNVKDIEIFGEDLFKLLSKASSQAEGWMKSTKAMEVAGGCVVQVTTQQRNPDGSYSVAEAVTFVPGVGIATEYAGGTAVSRKLV